MKERRPSLFPKRYEVRAKFLSGAVVTVGRTDDADDADAVLRAERMPGVVAARLFNPKTGEVWKPKLWL
jgi:hypothetical protein